MSNEFPKMLFKHGGPHQFHGSNFHTLTVGHNVAEAEAINNGWHLNTANAVEAKKAQLAAEIEHNNTKIVKVKKPANWSE